MTNLTKLSNRLAAIVVQRNAPALRQVVNQANGVIPGVDPQVVARREEYRQLFGTYRPYLAGIVRQCMEISKVAEALGQNDFMKDTGHGSRALAAAGKLTGRVEKSSATLTTLATLEAKLDTVNTMAALAEFKEFSNQVQQQIADAKPEAEEVGKELELSIEFEAIKAIVMADPKNTHHRIDIAFGIVNGGLSVAVMAGTATGLVPSPYTKPVTLALNTTARVLKVGTALAKRQAVAMQNASRVEQYRKTHGDNDIWKAHNDDPTLMAQRLASKFKADVDIALTCADVPMGVVADLLTTFANDPGIAAFVWDRVRTTLQSGFNAYADAKVDKLATQLKGAQKQTLAEKAKEEVTAAAKGFVDELKGQILGDFTAALSPITLIGNAVLNTATDRVVKAFVSALPVDPAQGVDGAALQGAMADIADAVATGAPKRDAALADKMEADERAARVGNWVPKADNAGRPVDMVLGDIQTDGQGQYRRVKIGAELGKLYHDGLVFVAEPQQPGDDVLLASIPKTDSAGRALDEVDFDLGPRPKAGMPPPDGLQGNHFWARIGRVWGYVDSATRQFYPADVHKTAFGIWNQRRIDKKGYYEGGQLVEGKWYQPFPHLTANYLFVGPLGQEWAKAGDATAAGSGNANNIVNALTAEGVNVSTSFDLATLR